jgi:Flp pilus assembly protein TadG
LSKLAFETVECDIDVVEIDSNQHRSVRRQGRRGQTLILATACMTVMLGFLSLAVDFGRINVAKSELQSVTDAATRSAAQTMRSLSAGKSAASASAAALFAASKVDGATPTFDPNTDLTLGLWDPATKLFIPATVQEGANAIKINAKVTIGGADRPFAFLSAIRGSMVVDVECVAMVSGTKAQTYVSGNGNPWLAGMPAGSKTDNLRPESPSLHDHAGSSPNAVNSPGMINLSESNIFSGQVILFDTVTGTANNVRSSVGFSPDGNLGFVVSLGTASADNSASWSRSVNGLSNVKAPINSMVAVFLNDNAPNTTAAPSNLDFSTADARDYVSLAPQLKQVFFVGDGRRSNGEAQQITVPPGATRMFIGNMDAWQWNDNSGGYNATINSVIKVTTVR